MADEAGVPYLRVVRGDATAEEIAALVTVLGALAARRGAAARRGQRAAPSNWNDMARLLKAPRYQPATGWRRSALP